MQALQPGLWRQQARRAIHLRSIGGKRARQSLFSIYNQARLGRQQPPRQEQHNYHGPPHKEYFQTPGQMPAPDTTPYIGQGPHSGAYPVPPQYTAAGVPIPPPPPAAAFPTPPSGPSLLRRATRSVLWAVLFGVLGAAAGTALITWEYLQPPFEPGSPEEEELNEEIWDTLESHPLVISLREEGWVEEDYYAGKAHGPGSGHHLVAETLTGMRGITMRVFRHPTLHFSMLVFFLGFGIEGWPDVVHGGVITTLLQEGINRQIETLYKHYGTQREQLLNVDFKRPMRPGDIYAVLVPPAQLEVELMPDCYHLEINAMLVHLENPPRIRPESTDGIVVDRTTIELAGSRPAELIHALATAQVRMVTDVSDERLAKIEAQFEEERRLLEETDRAVEKLVEEVAQAGNKR
ncbi:hypothetical protein ABEF92_006801 [Exophiala dermatitidis]|uniref:Thioesterase domain-containing protein n=1 Tax=Exophiala dermatitidis (strain ATCC 34100 / CBS 525.76 / NIH/UT8656) TaxID=858893 RepID=H6C0F2_EXODN|nr:uncharacterized protein HMPREF1120_04462 [Exophiala dermatitidis NIH/UT8656]EHY56380.1 hypothetical protein HMPREF1120_04462 [Exophiala dermatitidis NIH/UT8656]